MTEHQDPIEIATLATLPWEEAWLLAGRLQSDGIEAHVYPEDQTQVYGTSLRRSVDVVVPAASLEDARTRLATYGTE